MSSEIARLLSQITLSYEAAQRAFNSPAIMAPHEFITKRMEEIEVAQSKIAKLVGSEFAATEMVVKQLATIEEVKQNNSTGV